MLCRVSLRFSSCVRLKRTTTTWTDVLLSSHRVTRSRHYFVKFHNDFFYTRPSVSICVHLQSPSHVQRRLKTMPTTCRSLVPPARRTGRLFRTYYLFDIISIINVSWIVLKMKMETTDERRDAIDRIRTLVYLFIIKEKIILSATLTCIMVHGHTHTHTAASAAR